MTITASEIALTLTYLRDAGLLIATDTQATTWADYLSREIPDLTARELPDATRRAIRDATLANQRTVTVGHMATAIRRNRAARIDADRQAHGDLTAPSDLAGEPDLWVKWLQAAQKAIGRGASREEATAFADRKLTEKQRRRLSDGRTAADPTPGRETHSKAATSAPRPLNGGTSRGAHAIGSDLQALKHTLTNQQGAAA